MSKELRPLEAFNDLMAVYYENNIIKEKCGITEKTFNEKRNIIENALKALEIIKENTDLCRGIDKKGNKCSCLVFKIMETDKEFDLIKEVLK